MTDILIALLNMAIPTFAISSMLSVGLRYELRQVVAPLKDVPGVITAVVANFVLVPLFAYGIVKVLQLERPYAVGMILVACAAGAPLLVKLAQNAEEDVAFAAAILVLLLVVTIVYMPLVVPFLTEGAPVSAWSIARPLLLTMLLPMIVGFVAKRFFPGWMQSFLPYVGMVANIALWSMITLTVVTNLGEVLSVFGTGAIFASILLIAGAFIIGYLAGTFDKAEKLVLGFGTAQRNFGAATVVAVLAFDDSRVLVMTVVISTVAIALIPISSIFGKRKAKTRRLKESQTNSTREGYIDDRDERDEQLEA